ncbi:hypothetical protein Tco_0986964 [Tanacetum coccineum]
MDPHTSLGRMCINENHNVTQNDLIESAVEWSGLDYLDTIDSRKKKKTKAYTFYRMKSEEVCEWYITPCFVEGLYAFEGVNDLEYEKNLISNEFVVKLGLTYEVMENGDKVVDRKLLVSIKGELYFVDFFVNPKEDDVEPCVIFGRSFLKIAKAIIDFGSEILNIWPETIIIDSDDDELDTLLACININKLPPIDITNFLTFVCNMGKDLRNKKKPTKTYKMSYDGEGPSLTINRPETQQELTREELEEDLYERIMLLNEKRPIIETLKYGDKHKMLLDSVLLDKLKLDGEFELEEDIVGEQVIMEYKVIKEKEDPGYFVLRIRLEGNFDFHALVDTVSNINMMPYCIYDLLDREKVKPRIDKVRMLDHSNAETMGCLLNVLCQVGVTIVLANFILLDIPVYRDVPIIVRRSFMYTCGDIMNTFKGKMITFDGFMHQQLRMVKVRNVHEESDSDDEEEYSLKMDYFWKTILWT